MKNFLIGVLFFCIVSVKADTKNAYIVQCIKIEKFVAHFGSQGDILSHFNGSNKLDDFLNTWKKIASDHTNLEGVLKNLNKENKIKFYDDFAGADATALKALDDESDLVDVWKGVISKKIPKKDIGFLQWAKKLKDRNQAQGKNLYDHIFVGKTGGTNGISGVHHKNALTTKTSGFINGDIRIKSGTKTMKTDGFYEAEIEYFNGNNWITKIENGVPVKNGFFPDNMQPDEIIEEIAFARCKMTIANYTGTKNQFEASLTNGQKVIFYIGSGNFSGSTLPTYLVSVFPIF